MKYSYRPPPGDDTLMYLIAIGIIGAGGYYAWDKGMFSTKITFEEIKEVKESKPDDVKNDVVKNKQKQKADVPGMCQLDCSSIPGSSCVNGKCTDPYLYLQRL